MLASLTVHELGARFRRGEATPSQAAQAYLERIDALDPQVRAYLTVTREEALKQAAAADLRFKSATPLGPLDGVPIGKGRALHARHPHHVRLENS